MHAHAVSFRRLESDIKSSLKSQTLVNDLYNSTHSLALIAVAALESEGAPGWTKTLPFFQEQNRDKIEQTLAPLVNWWLDFVRNNGTKGGGGGGGGGGDCPPTTPIIEDYSIDGIYDAAIRQMQRVNDATQEFASKYGILAFEKSYDDGETDPYPLAPIGNILTPIFPPAKVLAEIPVPARAITVIVYTILDVLRVSLAASGIESPMFRKILSLTLSLADFLRGDWKKALLSFAGFYGTNYVVFGYFAKLFLDIFSLINPELQMAIVYGTKDVFKSLIAGSLLFVYQISAPAVAREPLAKYFAEVDAAVQKRRISEREANPNLPPNAELKLVPAYLVPTFQHIQNLQATLGSPISFCPLTDTIKRMVGSGENKNYIMTLFFQLLNVPTTDEELDEKCAKWADQTNAVASLSQAQSDADLKVPAPVPAPVPVPPPLPQSPPQPNGAQTPNIPAEIPKNNQTSPPLPQESAEN